ncbi:Transcriptional regulator, LysR family [Labilithrix luteola]|uniref:Transcriptional regulator, LysR family n=1 Tax=Labilithrix luteola TaxID=1391654 RepID=A0A0K1PPZ4_9BACT|nr:LysR family transcriptional regulator [Labilithrix luteola]AKU95592.1 Transcriptional regulator, LysR family [Labilithrix luteola]
MVNVSGVDLNLFAVLGAVLAERSVTRAAKQLHVTPPAVSNSLARLRDILGDPLVVRSGNGLVPTPRAEELAPLLESALEQLKVILDSKRGFVATETTRVFTLAAADSNQVCDVPRVIEAFAQELPRAKLRIVSSDYLLSSGGLATGEIDAAFGVDGMPLSSGWLSRAAYDEVGALVVRRDHPRVRRRMTPELFNSLQHIDVQVALGRTGTGHDIAERMWRSLGLSREVVLSVPHFVAAAMAAARTDYVAALPRRVADTLCAILPLKIVQPTFTLPAASVTLVWHARTDADAGARYFRDLIVRAVHAPRRPS